MATESIIVRWLAAGDAGRFDEFDALLDPDVVVHAPAGLSSASAAQEKEVWRAALAAVSGLRHDVQEVVAAEGVEMARVVVTGSLTSKLGDVEGTGRPFRLDQAVIVHLVNGRIVEAWEIADTSAVASPGAPESTG